MSSSNLPKQLDAVLGEHQREAINFALDRLHGAHPHKAALLRMPTGTGKTGVIAVLSIAVPETGWSLILTPWKNLCDQLVEDLGTRFWAARKWSPSAKLKVERLYPKNLSRVLKKIPTAAFVRRNCNRTGAGELHQDLCPVTPCGQIARTDRTKNVPNTSEFPSGDQLASA